MPPLATRPKAATVGVGRQVILRPAVQKRYVELAEPTLADQQHRPRAPAGGARRPRAAGRPARVAPAAEGPARQRLRGHRGRGGRRADRRRAGRHHRARVRHRVRPRHHDGGGDPARPGDGHAGRGALDAEPAAAVRRRRHHPDQRHDAGPGRARPPAATWPTRRCAELAEEVCAEGGVDAGRGLRGRAGRQRHDDRSWRSGIDPEPLGVAPFIMATRTFPEMRASDLGIAVHPGARAVVFPALGAYVGGDIVAGMLASGMDRDRRLRLFIDVGTNCEIVLGNSERLLATAAPAGPAFEGAAIRCGMRAADGAIEVVKVSRRRRELQVIGDVEPRRAVRLRAGRRRGRAGRRRADRRLRPAARRRRGAPIAPRPGRPARDGQRRAGVRPALGPTSDAGSVYLSQRDVRELQFAKAAISTGWRCWSRSSGSRRPTSSRCCWPGRSAATCPRPAPSGSGWCPTLPVLRIVSAGNVAGEGAKMALLSMREREGAADPAEGGALRRALRPARLQRPLHRPARLPRLTRHQPAFDPRRRSGTERRSPAAVAVVACGAIARDVSEIAPGAAGRWTCIPLPPLLHNRPERIAGAVGRRLRRAAPGGTRDVAVAYADCGTYGALDAVCERLGCRAWPARTATTCSPGRTGCGRCSRRSRARTCSPTSWPGRSPALSWPSSASTATPSCARTTSATTAGWCGWPSDPTPELEAAARDAAAAVGLPLQAIVVGDLGLEAQLTALVAGP